MCQKFERRYKNGFKCIIALTVLAIVLTPVLAVAQTKTKLTIVIPTGPRYGFAAKGMAKEFMDKNPTVNIEVETYPYMEYYTKIALDLAAAGRTYDLAWVDYAILGGYVESNYLMPLESYIQNSPDFWATVKGDIPKRVLDVYRWGGTLYCIPGDSNAQIYYYRKDVLDSKGLSLPDTWDKILEVAPKLHNPPDMYALAIALLRPFAHSAWLPLLWSKGGELWDENFVPQFNSPEAIWALNLLKELYQYMPSETLTWAESDSYEAMGSAGLFALAPCTWAGAVLTNPEYSRLANKIGSTIAPALSDGSRVPAMGGFGWGINSRVPSKRKKAAWDFIMFYLAKDNQQMLVSYTGQPARLSALTDPVNVKLQPYFPALAESLSFAHPLPSIPEYLELRDHHGLLIGKALMGELTVEEVANQSNERVYTILKEAGRIKE